MALIKEDESTVALGELVDLIKRSDVTVHGEDTISDDDSEAAVLSILELLLENLHVHVLVPHSARFAKSDSINDTCVVELVRDDSILWGEAGLEEASVGVEATWVQNRIIKLVEVRDATLEILMDVLGTANEPYRGHAETVSSQSVFGGLDDSRMVRESQVVIGTEVEDALTVGFDLHILSTGNHSFGLVGTHFLHAIKLGLTDGSEAVGSSREHSLAE